MAHPGNPLEAALARGITHDTDRHGNVRVYYRRRQGPKIRLHEPEGSEAFERELASARLGRPYVPAEAAPKPAPEAATVLPGSLRALCEAYLTRFVSTQAAATRRKKRAVLMEICAETQLSESGRPNGDMAVSGFRRKHIALIRDAKAGFPEAANHRLKVLSHMWAWALDAGEATSSPVDRIIRFKGRKGGHYTPTREELKQFEAFWPPGSKPRRAYAILLYAGLRVCDGAIFGRQHLYEARTEGGAPQRRFRLTPIKTAGSSDIEVDMEIAAPLAAELDLVPKTQMTFLLTEWGKPFSAKGFSKWMAHKFALAGLPHVTGHGLRKAGPTISADNGATAHQLMAAWGWVTLKQAETYTRKAARKRLADAAQQKLAAG